MIYLDGLGSIIESIYLGDSVSNKSNTCDVYVNPGAVKYLTGKIIIINTLNYPAEKLQDLIKNQCTIISRVFIDNPAVEIRPYILKINERIMWNGRELSAPISFGELLNNGWCDYSGEILYFPKIETSEDILDEYGNLTVLGWVLQQTGVNIKTDTPFIDLDIIKTGKMI